MQRNMNEIGEIWHAIQKKQHIANASSLWGSSCSQEHRIFQITPIDSR